MSPGVGSLGQASSLGGSANQAWLPKMRPGLEQCSLLAKMRKNPWSFDFFQAVFLLRRFQEDVVEPGFLGPPSKESVRFTARNSLNFPASQIQEIAGADRARPSSRSETNSDAALSIIPEMEVNFIGLQGPSGVLPNFYTQLINDLDREKDNPEKDSFKAWLNLFNHRLTSLFYRTWVKYRPSVVMQSDFNIRPGGFDPFTEANLSIIGMGQLGLRGRIGRLPESILASATEEEAELMDGQRPGSPAYYPFDDRFLITHGAALSREVRTAAGLQSMLADYLVTPVVVGQFAKRWLGLNEDCQTALMPSLTNEANPADRFGSLGCGAICGSRIIDIQNHFLVKIGPIEKPLLNQFLPAVHFAGQAVPSPLLRTTLDLIRHYARSGLDFQVRVAVAGCALPDPVLAPGSGAPILGQSVWLYREKPVNSKDDLVFGSEIGI